VVLANFIPREGGGVSFRRWVTMNYAAASTAIFATGRKLALADLQPWRTCPHDMFYRQLLRWVVSDTAAAHHRIDGPSAAGR